MRWKIFKNKSNAEQLISLLEKTYWGARKEFPNQDEHFYLAKTLFMPFAARAEIGQNPLDYIIKVWKFEVPDHIVKTWKSHWEGFTTFFSYAETETFSILDPPVSIKALSYFAVYKEFPKESYRYDKEFNQIMFPILKMTRHDFSTLYKLKNPNSYRKATESDIAFSEQTTNLNPNDEEAHYQLANAYHKAEMYEKAVESFQKALSLKPNFTDAFINLGCSLSKLGMYRESIEPFKKAIEIKPTSADAHYNLGITLLCLGETNEASKEYMILKNLNTKLAEVLIAEIEKKYTVSDEEYDKSMSWLRNHFGKKKDADK